MADRDLLTFAGLFAYWGRSGQRARPITATERTLLAACNITLPDDALTVLFPVTDGIVGRTWFLNDVRIQLDPKPTP